MVPYRDQSLPGPTKYHTALTFFSPSAPPKLKSLAILPFHVACAGTVLVKPLYAPITPHAKEIFTNNSPLAHDYEFPYPIVLGESCIARVVSVPADTPGLKPGQLVYIEQVLRTRSDPHTLIPHGASRLSNGIYRPANERALLPGRWRNGSWAELLTVSTKSVHVLDEDILVGQLGYKLEELGTIGSLIVPCCGLLILGLRPGDTVLIAPATGSSGSAAVQVALAMRAKVIAMVEDEGDMAEVANFAEKGKLCFVKTTGNVQEDVDAVRSYGRIDVFFNTFSPNAIESSHAGEVGFRSLRTGGRANLMDCPRKDIELPYTKQSYSYIGRTDTWPFMNTAEHVEDLVRTVERGVFKIGERAGLKVAGIYKLQEWKKAFDVAAAAGQHGHTVYFVPNREEEDAVTAEDKGLAAVGRVQAPPSGVVHVKAS
ncbi:hypothetical protein MMC10_002658 [Thelotrema lepadinum]|nr:hypothetical protein [Thelotrema lepadinum]